MDESLKTRLKELGVTDAAIAVLDDQEITTEAALTGFTYEQYTALGIKAGSARILANEFGPKTAPALAVSPAPAGSTSGGDDIPEGKTPSPTQVSAFATQLGMDPATLSMFLFANMGAGAGMGDMDLSGIIPIPAVVGGYNPKIRNIPFMIMGQIERRLGTPIVVINADGSVNAELTSKYVMSLEEGFDPAPDNVYYDESGAPYEVIKVGVDAQGIYDADPIQPSRALQQNGMGVGRINWHNVPLEVRQVVYYAATQTGELSVADESALNRLRDKISPTTTRLNLRGDFPKAMAAYNEGARTGSLPTLRVQLARSARRPEVMPRRRTAEPRDLSGLREEGGAPTSGAGFPGTRF